MGVAGWRGRLFSSGVFFSEALFGDVRVRAYVLCLRARVCVSE